MGMIGGVVARAILSRYEWHDLVPTSEYKGRTKLETLFGPSFWDGIRGRTVIDFGCGIGDEAMEMARAGAAEVVGLEIRADVLASARARQAAMGPPHCAFERDTDVTADVITSIDSFEHFDDPPAILQTMRRLLRADGKVLIAFGFPWYHPFGGHLPLFPWGHLVFTETALMKWRAQFKTDGATRFCEMAGGLNKMSLGKFQRVVAESPFRIERLDTMPIRAVRRFHCRATREFFTSIIRATLRPRAEAQPPAA